MIPVMTIASVSHPPTLPEAPDSITAAGFKDVDVRCNSGHDDSSKTHLLDVWELVVRGLKAVIVQNMNTHTHTLLVEIILRCRRP